MYEDASLSRVFALGSALEADATAASGDSRISILFSQLSLLVFTRATEDDPSSHR